MCANEDDMPLPLLPELSTVYSCITFLMELWYSLEFILERLVAEVHPLVDHVHTHSRVWHTAPETQKFVLYVYNLSQSIYGVNEHF